jgi:hypothetical protein
MVKAKVLMLPVLLVFFLLPAFAAEKTDIGPNLPPFTLEKPESAEVQKYLGLEKMEPFTLSQIQGKMVLIEIMSAL